MQKDTRNLELSHEGGSWTCKAPACWRALTLLFDTMSMFEVHHKRGRSKDVQHKTNSCMEPEVVVRLCLFVAIATEYELVNTFLVLIIID